jgi:hypothetical protein
MKRVDEKIHALSQVGGKIDQTRREYSYYDEPLILTEKSYLTLRLHGPESAADRNAS